MHLPLHSLPKALLWTLFCQKNSIVSFTFVRYCFIFYPWASYSPLMCLTATWESLMTFKFLTLILLSHICFSNNSFVLGFIVGGCKLPYCCFACFSVGPRKYHTNSAVLPCWRFVHACYPCFSLRQLFFFINVSLRMMCNRLDGLMYVCYFKRSQLCWSQMCILDIADIVGQLTFDPGFGLY